jgi:hypothetical protein
MFSASPESPPLFIVDPTVLSRQLHRDNNLCVSERHDPRTEVARRPIWGEVAGIRPARIWRGAPMPTWFGRSPGHAAYNCCSPGFVWAFRLLRLASVHPETLSFWNRWLKGDFWEERPGAQHAFTAAPIWCQQRASPSWLIGRAEDRTYCKIVIIQRLSALDLAARNIWTPRRNFAV